MTPWHRARPHHHWPWQHFMKVGYILRIGPPNARELSLRWLLMCLKINFSGCQGGCKHALWSILLISPELAARVRSKHLLSVLDAGNGHGDLARHKDLAAARGLVVEQDAAAGSTPRRVSAANHIHSLHAFQSADQVRCSRHSMAALQPALSWDFLHHLIICEAAMQGICAGVLMTVFLSCIFMLLGWHASHRAQGRLQKPK